MAVVNINSIRNFSFRNAYEKTGRSVSRFMLDLSGSREKLPTVSKEKNINAIKWIGEKLSSAENRLILGASALMSQPFIDAANKDVDEETRRISICRTVAKIIAGTLTGYSIRKLCIKSIDAFTQHPEKVNPNVKFKSLRSCLLPTIEHTASELAQYKNTLGTILGLGVMIFTNFLIDAPLTKYLTNLFAGKGGKDNAKSC